MGKVKEIIGGIGALIFTVAYFGFIWSIISEHSHTYVESVLIVVATLVVWFGVIYGIHSVTKR